MLDLILYFGVAVASVSALQSSQPPFQPPAAQLGDGVSREPVPVDAATLESEARRSEAWLNNPAAHGLVVSATIAPAAARVLVTWRNGEAEQRQECSGVLVGPSRVLTAAHCVCGRSANVGWYAADAGACRSQLARLEVEVLFSGVGAYGAAGLPRVAPQYRSSEQGPSANLPVADLAVIDLSESPPIAPARIAAPNPSARHLLVSFGVMTLAATPTDSFWRANIPYQSGLKQASVHPGVRTDPNHCGAAASQDTICSIYDGVAVSAGPDMDAGVCGGDSGAPLFQAGPDGSLRVVGIASYFHPPAYACDASAGRHSHFVAAGRYAEWIDSVPPASPPPPPSPPLACGEGIVAGPVRFSLQTDSRAYLTVSALDLEGRERPSVRVGGPGMRVCRRNSHFGYSTCFLGPTGVHVVTLSGGLAQVALCRER